MNSLNKVFHSLAAAVLLLGSGAVYAGTAGYVQFVNGEVQLTTADGKTRNVQKGDAVNEGDTLTSAKAASAQIKMQDGGLVAMRPDTKLKFDSFKFSGREDGSEQSFYSLFKGGFRAVTGFIGRINKPSYRITTPTSTIGIRGTDHETFVVVPESELAAVAPTGAYNKVNLGETYISTEKGTIFVLPNQMGFAGAKDQMPRLQPLNTNIFTVAPAPTPQAKGDKKEGKEEGVRETALVDNTAHEQAAAPAPTAAAPGNTVTPDIIQLPVTTTGGTTLTGGGGTPLTGSPTYAAQNGFGYEALGVDAAGMWINPWDTNLPATSYLLDAANNLIEVVGGISPGKVAGGVAKDTFVAADSSVYMGRWEGGTYTDSTTMIPVAMGATSMQWMLTANPPLGFVQTLVGTTNYALTAATHPTDKFGNVGTLTAATLTADFTNQLVNASLALSFSTADPINISTQNKAFTVTASALPIIGDTIWSALVPVVCTGVNCAVGGYAADIWARFAANTADKVAIPYNIVSNTLNADVVQGVALVTAATPPIVLPPSAPYVQTDLAVANATLDLGGTMAYANNTFIAASADTSNTLPTPFLIDRYAGNGPGSSITHTFSGTTTVGEATTTLANGIQFGRYDSTQGQMVVVGSTYTGLAPGTYLSGGAVKSHWIAGPAIDPVYLPEVLLTPPNAPAVYTFAGGTTPTALTGAVSTLNTATLSVNFTNQLVSLSLGLTVGVDAWTASTANAPLEMMYWNNAKSGFVAKTPTPGIIPPGRGTLAVTCPSCTAGVAFGTVTGQLTGSGLNGAILSYLLGDGIGQAVAGAAAFTGIAQNTATPYRIAGLSSIDWNPPANAFPVGVAPYPIPGTLGGYTNAGTVLTDAAGNVTQFNASQPFTNGAGITVGIGTATPAGLGTDPVSGISWGRWVGGTLSKTDLATGAITPHPNTAGGIAGGGAALSTHWVASPTLVGPVTLPISGTYNYVLAGGTAPTDSLGNVGTLNSATLSANFTAQTVAVGINVTTAGAGNLIASGANIPIEQKSMFNASTAGSVQGGNPSSLTVTGSVAGTPQGHVGGAFAGAGGIGAAMIYGLVSGNGVIVNGVTAFHR